MKGTGREGKGEARDYPPDLLPCSPHAASNSGKISQLFQLRKPSSKSQDQQTGRQIHPGKLWDYAPGDGDADHLNGRVDHVRAIEPALLEF